MSSDGKHLEALVKFVEESLLPSGFEVKANERVFNEDGIQIAEFDIEIKGKVGSTAFHWLIECRDRPTSGPAPGSWIEQLYGRRSRFGFNKVTAVSTTGFAAGAIEYAESVGIELREVAALTPSDFADWLMVDHMRTITRHTTFLGASLLLHEAEAEDRHDALRDLLAGLKEDSEILKSSKTGQRVLFRSAFAAAVGSAKTLFDDVEPNGAAKRVRLHVNYTNDDDHFIVETIAGNVRIYGITFRGELSIKEAIVPLEKTSEYRHASTEQSISQTASFAPQMMNGVSVAVEMHRMTNTGETYVVLRRVQGNA